MAIRKNGISRKQKQHVIELRTLGFSYEEIARETGVSRGTAHGIIKELGKDPKVQPIFAGTLKQFLGLRGDGWDGGT